MTKNELRKVYLSKRLQLSDAQCQNYGKKIRDHFFQSIPLQSVKTIHVFLPILTKQEPNTWLIIDRLQKEYSWINIIIPRINGEQMENILLEDNAQLKENKWNILEPQFGKEIKPEEIDLVIIPLLAFDEQGHRVGYGRGYYDRFLVKCRPDCIKIGISFFPPEKLIEEKLEADVLLDQCITPDKIYTF